MPIIPGPPGGPIPQSFRCSIPKALLMLPCTMNELAELGVRSAISSVVIAPSVVSVAVATVAGFRTACPAASDSSV